MAAGVFPVCPLTTTTYTYDAAGQLTQRQSSTLPSFQSSTSFAYDGLDVTAKLHREAASGHPTFFP